MLSSMCEKNKERTTLKYFSIFNSKHRNTFIYLGVPLQTHHLIKNQGVSFHL